MKFKDLEKKLLADKKFKKEYLKKDDQTMAIEIGSQILDERIKKGITQEILAKKIGTKQPSIARIERGATLPSLSFLQKIASALGIALSPPRFNNTTEHKSETSSVVENTNNNNATAFIISPYHEIKSSSTSSGQQKI